MISVQNSDRLSVTVALAKEAMSVPASLFAASIGAQLDHHLDQAEFVQAATLLIAQLPPQLPTALQPQVNTLLARFPAALRADNPDLLYLQSLLLAQTQTEVAATQLVRALLLYRAQGQLKRAANCYFELIRIYAQREDFRTALLYVGEAEALLHQLTDPRLEAQLFLRLAELCPDLGRLQESIDYAQRALTGFRAQGEIQQQFKTHILLAVLHRQLGDYHAAEAQLELGRRLHQAGQLGDEAYTRVLNAAAHLAWYRGDLSAAQQHAEQLVHYTDKTKLPKAKVYSALLLGNLYRAQGFFATAQHWYTTTRTLIQQAAVPLFLPWVDVQEGWLYVLTGDYATARRLIHRALTTTDRGQLMSFNVHLALLNLLEGQVETAAKLLQSAQAFYQQSGDELATAVIDLYLAYTLHQQDQPAVATAHLQAGFDWFAARHITCFPLWWHSPLVAQICVLALRAAMHIDLVEHMIAYHVGTVARPLLATLLDEGDGPLAQRVRPILALLTAKDEAWLTWLATVEDEMVRQVLETLLQQNSLRRAKLDELQATLRTAQQREKTNPVLIAVFGRYLQGATIKEIAVQLQRAPSSIRNYVTTIYQIFGLSPAAYASLQARRTALIMLARVRGWIE